MLVLDPVAVRVLGALMEKEATTPEYYPLSLNALVNACNQKSNRQPVVEYDEDTVSDAMDGLRAVKLAVVITGSGRVSKYAQRISESLNLGRREMAVLCVLLLRGPQTLGEIKDRSERMHAFADLEEVERALDKLAEWPDVPLVRKLPRQPGQKEVRYAHLLAGEPAVQAEDAAPAAPNAPGSRIAVLEEEVRRLSSAFAELKQRFDDLEAQFR
ncbi:MAG TPA: YceH family protein [Bryobacteraceae bacterium]|nr:YceH family protein [Bryobacteraceae bacterium]